MANEVHIIEMERVGKQCGEAVNTLTQPITTQFINIGDTSAKLNDTTEFVRVKAIGTGFFFAFGDSAVSAGANADGSIWIDAGETLDFHIINSDKYIGTTA